METFPVPAAQANGNQQSRNYSVAQVLSQSGFFSDARDACKAQVKVWAGEELGLGRIASMTGIFIVQGRVTLGANVIAAVILRSPDYRYHVKTMTDDLCEIEFFRKGDKVGTSSFSMKDGQKAGLAGKDTWKKFPRNMLFSRAISNGAKWFCPELFMGMPPYTPDEINPQITYDAASETYQIPPEDEEDDDEDDVPAGPVRIPEEAAELFALARETNTDLTRLLAHLGASCPERLTAGQIEAGVKVLRIKKTSLTAVK